MQAIVLAAGFGSRLQGRAPLKPLAVIAGRPLLAHVLERLAIAGVDDVVVVLGHGGDAIAAMLPSLAGGLATRTVSVSDPSLPNGVSALAGASFTNGRTLLTMSDHLVEPGLYRRVADAPARDGELLLGVDRRLDHPWVDPDDVTRVQTEGGRILAIGKALEPFNGHDTGVFSVDHGLWTVLGSLSAPSLSAGVALLARQGLASAVETGECDWLDVDDPRALDIAEHWLGAANV